MLENLTLTQILFCLNHCGKPFNSAILNQLDYQTFNELINNKEQYSDLIIEIKRGIYQETLHQVNPEIFNNKTLLEALIKRTWNAHQQTQSQLNC